MIVYRASSLIPEGDFVVVHNAMESAVQGDAPRCAAADCVHRAHPDPW